MRDLQYFVMLSGLGAFAIRRLVLGLVVHELDVVVFLRVAIVHLVFIRCVHIGFVAARKNRKCARTRMLWVRFGIERIVTRGVTFLSELVVGVCGDGESL